MKRNLDLIRLILIEIENASNKGLYLDDLVKALNVDIEIINYQVNLLHDAKFIKLRGLVTVLTPQSTKYDDFKIDRLTLAGHDYLDAIRSDTVWNKLKEKTGSLFTSLAFSVIKDESQKLIKELLD